MTKIIVLLFVVLSCSHAVLGQSYTYCSAKTVKDVYNSASLTSQVSPALNNCGGLSCSFYMSSSSCMGPFGPIGCYGPLGMLGPVQESYIDGASSYSDLLSSLGNWYSDAGSKGGKMDLPMGEGDGADPYFKNVAENGGALSEAGPLGPNGPLGDSYYTMDQVINDFAGNLAAMGVFTPLGPIGPLGALGPLGILGPLSAVSLGYQRDSNGNYLLNGNVARTVSVPWNGNSRTYGLFEWYDADFAKKMKDNDVSWMVRDVLNSGTVSYPFTSTDETFVTIVVLGEYQLDSFTLTLEDTTGRIIAKSDCDSSSDRMNWIQVRVPAGMKMRIRVAVSAWGLWQHAYRLFVVGAPKELSTTSCSGPHVKTWTPPSSQSFLSGTETSDNNSHNDTLIAAVAGGVGGALLVAFAVATVFVIRIRRRRRDNVDLAVAEEQASQL